MKKFLKTLMLAFLITPVFAQEDTANPAEAAERAAHSLFTPTNIFIGVLIVTTLLLLAVALVLLKSFKAMEKELASPTAVPSEDQPMLEYDQWKALQKSKPGLWAKILSLKPLSEEKDILIEHEFDGISELDNPTPPWFNWLFTATIVIAVGYFLTYEVFGWGQNQEQEYVAEMTQAKIEKEKYLATSGNNIDENSVKESNDAAIISAGLALYTSNCIACHGDKGQGTVGPNLTDDYWLHGGSVNSIFKTIKYGVPEKGMIAWEKTLTPKQISEVANYILSLKGTNPPNPKAPQGDKEG